MEIGNLTIGRMYFQVTYTEHSLTKPVIISYEYICEETRLTADGNQESGFLFKYHPPFKYDDEELSKLDGMPVFFNKKQTAKLNDILELIDELSKIANRIEHS